MSLFEDVKELVSHGISNINCTDDVDRILLVGRNKTIKIDEGDDLNDIEEEALYLKYHWLQRQLQLALNMANNEEYFRLCWCSKPNETKKQISKEEIIDLIIEYIKCKEVLTNRENKSQNFIIEKCDICETGIVPDENHCSACKEPVKDIISRTRRKSKEVNDIKSNKGPNVENGSVRNDVYIKSNKEEKKENECGIIDRNEDETFITDLSLQDYGNSNLKTNDNTNIDQNYTILSGDKSKWLCIGCTFLNSYDFINCQICEKTRREFGIWMCEQCECMNEAVVDKCSACETENLLMKSSESEVKQDYNNNKCKWPGKQIGTHNNSNQNLPLEKVDSKQKLNCWNKDCKQSNNTDIEFCHNCKLQRDPPINASDLVKKCTKKNVTKIWICQKCSKHNEEDHPKCQGGNCGALRLFERTLLEDENKINRNRMNDLGVEPKSQKTPSLNEHFSKNHLSNETGNMNVNSDLWQCWYCNKSNESFLDYCENCCLKRSGTSDQGAIVHWKTKSGIKQIWVCYKCRKYNELSVKICAEKGCSQSRFTDKKK